MNPKRFSVVFSALLLLFLLSTSENFASVSSTQEKLRAVQLDLIKKQIQLIEAKALQASKDREAERDAAEKAAAAVDPTLSREEVARGLQDQIYDLQLVIRGLKPRSIEEETARIEAEIHAINSEVSTASGQRLLTLQRELQEALVDYEKLQADVRDSLEEELRQKQASVLRVQVRELQEKIARVPRPAPKKETSATPSTRDQIATIQEQLKAAQVRLVQEQMSVVQAKIFELQAEQK